MAEHVSLHSVSVHCLFSYLINYWTIGIYAFHFSHSIESRWEMSYNQHPLKQILHAEIIIMRAGCARTSVTSPHVQSSNSWPNKYNIIPDIEQMEWNAQKMLVPNRRKSSRIYWHTMWFSLCLAKYLFDVGDHGIVAHVFDSTRCGAECIIFAQVL